MRLPPRERLADWLGRQRWYAGRAVDADSLTLSTLGVAEQHGLTVSLTVVSTSDSSSHAQHYFVPLACATEGRSQLADPIYRGDLEWFDALGHTASARIVLELLGSARSNVHSTWLDTDPFDANDVCATIREQSNSSLLAGRHFAKVIRHLQPGDSPEVELGHALRESRHVAALSGWSYLDTPGGAAAALVIHRTVAGADGFDLAVQDAVRDAQGESELHFPGAAYELGITLGAVHADLIEAFGEHTGTTSTNDLSAWLIRRLDALGDVAVLAPYLTAAADTFREVARHTGPLLTHRVHGDLHLGQTLFADDGWRLIDFEGEPRRPVAERRLPASPMRDLAGVMRSIDYAARWRGAQSTLWRDRTTAMFLEGYQLMRPDVVVEPVLDALLMDKALYEVGYESLYRPERTRIPLAAVAALCAPA